MSRAKWRIAGSNFGHLHLGDNLRVAHEHPDVENAAVADDRPERMHRDVAVYRIPPARVLTDYRDFIDKA